MVQQLTIAYECISAIGNSLELEKMLENVVRTFVRKTGALHGVFVTDYPETNIIVSIGRKQELPKIFTSKKNGFEIFDLGDSLCLLDVPIRNEHFLFWFKNVENIELLGNMFSNFHNKLLNAIDACRSVEKLQKLNKNLTSEVTLAKNINAENEKLMISQSRMAIMGEMIGMIAHQWRQPITIIGMVTNNLIIDLEIGEFDQIRAIEDLNALDKQVHYLSQTIDDFRNFSKPNKRPQTTNFKDITQELYTILGKSFENHNIKLNFSGALTENIVSYKNELLQIFLNILTNSKDAFIEKEIQAATINFDCTVDAHRIVVTVQDNAGGIPNHVIGKIFEPYFSTKDEKHGTGLGLYMSSIIVEKHLGGTINVCSDNDGTIFRIQFKNLKEKELYVN